MDLIMYQIDAFADEVFKGNPAAIIPLEAWLPDEMLQVIALENNLAETAYFVPRKDAPAGHYDLRWFTPLAEVDLCGHATLASAYVLYEFLGAQDDVLTFHTRSGALTVVPGEGGLLAMDFPARMPTPLNAQSAEKKSFGADLPGILGAEVTSFHEYESYALAVLPDEDLVRNVKYTGAIEDVLCGTGYWGLIITAQANHGSVNDCVSRFFAPAKGVPEDPVTGSAHCSIAPYWAKQLGKQDLVAYQASPRGGTVHCFVEGDRVRLSGRGASYLKGTISIPGS